jgi:hypothetical protein
MSKSINDSNAILNMKYRNVAYPAVTAVYVALMLTLPAADGTGGIEVPTAGSGYARTVCSFGAAANGQITNNAECLFPEALADWGTVVGFCTFSAVTGGTHMDRGTLSSSRQFLTGDQPRFKVSSLTITES